MSCHEPGGVKGPYGLDVPKEVVPKEAGAAVCDGSRPSIPNELLSSPGLFHDVCFTEFALERSSSTSDF